MKTIMVRYKTNSQENADKNAALVRTVFEELQSRAPGGIRYASYRLEDGVSFVHIATHEGSNEALTQLPAFKEFQREIKSRCAEPPVVTELAAVGSYG
jgi:quinol monooxygenase YgiN